MNGRKVDLRRWVPVLVMLVALLGLVFIILDWAQIRTALAQASWKPIPFALAATVLSYACISYNFAQVSRMLGVQMRTWNLASIGFVSIVLNHLVSGAGAAGYSVRFLLMNRHGVEMSDVVAISFLHFYLTSLMMIAMLPASLLYLGLHASLGRTAAVALGLLAGVLFLVTLLATGMVFWGSMRKKAVTFLTRATQALFHRDLREPLERLEATMARAVQAMREQPATMAVIATLIVTDWAFSVTALYFCFRAFALAPSPGQLISGFVLGTVAGVVSLVPGGLGIQEGSMAGVVALFGIPFESAVLASVLYRAVYSMIPYLVSLGFYRHLIRQPGNHMGPHAQEVGRENPYA